MDYDRTDIAAVYDRGRDHGPEQINLWMNAIARHLNVHTPSWILDLGCGTGRFSAALSRHFNAQVVGLDPSLKMLQQAHGKHEGDRVHHQLGRAEALPLQSKSVDVIFASMSFHHFSDPWLAARECRRVIRDHGSVFIRTGTQEQIRSYPYYEYFPASHSILEEVLPTCAEVRAPFEAAGFHRNTRELITQTIAPSWEAYADKLAAGADSVLARLERRNFESGLNAVRQYGIKVGQQPIIEPIDLFVFS
jgi:ubiquinone/menaquinone biosynthesis C-methylase UbiE